MKHNKLLLSLLSAVTIVCMGTTMASADVEEAERMGLTLGVGLDVGHLQCSGDLCEDMTEAGGLNVHLGVLFTPQIAVIGDVWAMAHTEDRFTVSQGMATIGPQVWLMPRLWLRVGAGVGRASYSYDAEVVEFTDSTEWVPAAMAAIGFELLKSDGFALDLQARAGTAFFDDADTEIHNMSLGLGANWY